jgi:hypothetical protein
MYRNAALVAVMLAAVSVAWAQSKAPANAPKRAKVPDTLHLLNERIPEVRFQEATLESVIDWLGDFTKLNISVRWSTLKEVGIGKDTPISVQVRNLRLSQVLWLIMNEATHGETKLAYRASGNLLVLSTAEDLNKEMITKIYDVSDLLFKLSQAQPGTFFNITQGMQGGQSAQGGGSSGGGMFGQGQQNRGQQQGQGQGQGQGQDQTQIRLLMDVITQTVEPDSWRDNGGLGSILPYEHSLIVRNTILVHQLLGGYLTEEEVGGQ